MNLQNLRIFLKVAELEHITRASEELHLTQPAVTRIIQSLEHEVHLDLIEHQGRRIVLTYAGRVLQKYARQVFALEREMEEALASLREIEGGEVNFAVNTMAGVYLLPPIVARFHLAYPQVKLNIAIMNSQDIIAGTLDWSLDFGLIEGDTSRLSPLLITKFFARDHLILVISPDHRWSQCSSLTAEDIWNQQLLVREQGSAIRDVIARELECAGRTLVPLLTLTDNEAIKQMVINGVGAAVVSFLTVQRELASGDLVQIPVEQLRFQTPLSFIQRTDKQLSRAAQAFISFLFPLS